MLSPIAYRKLNEYGQKIVNRAKTKLRQKPLPANSNIIKSIKYKITQRNLQIIFEYNEYGKFIESGRRKGALPPPIKPIQEWIKKRNIDASPYAIAKSIAKKGIRPYKWLDVFPNGSNKATKEYEDILGQIFREQIEKDLKDLGL